MSRHQQPELGIVVDNTVADPEHAHRDHFANELMRLAELARHGHLAALYWVSVEHNTDVMIGNAGQAEKMADDALCGLQVLGERLCKVVGRKPGTAWASES